MFGVRRRSTASFFVLVVAGIALSLSSPSFAHSFGPPNGFCGDPPLYETCIACHSSYPLNSGLGHVAVSGMPASYYPNTTYPLTLTVVTPGQVRWGFEATMIKTSDQSRGGHLLPVDSSLVQVSRGSGSDRDYIKQTTAGTFNGQHDQASWQITWTAPDVGSGTTHFYLAGNGANGDGTPNGDFIYTTDVAVPENPNAGVTLLTDGAAIGFTSFPNPMNQQGTIRFQLPAGSAASLRVTDAAGRLVRILVSPSGPTGAPELLRWDSRDQAGRLVPAGIYEFSLQSGNRYWTRPVIVLR